MNRRRGIGLLILLGGLLALALVVLAFVGYARRDDRTLREGTHADGEVIGLAKPNAWDFMSSGQIVVRYELDGRRHVDRIWIDSELSEYALHEPVDVFVRGEHVRTYDEPNDPAPVGSALVLVGFVGLLGAGYGGLRLLPSSEEAAEGSLDVIPLKAFRLSPRKARIDVLPDGLSIYLPTYFGAHRLVVPRRGTVATFLDGPETESSIADDVFYKDEVRVAYFPTASQVKDGNLLLSCVEPVRVPPLRAFIAWFGQVDLPFTRRETRSEEDVRLDAVSVRVASPSQARQVLSRAGVPETADPDRWMVEHREIETDPEIVRELQREMAVEEHASRWSLVAFFGSTALLVAARVTDDFRLAVGGFVLLGGAWVLPWVVTRLGRRDRR